MRYNDVRDGTEIVKEVLEKYSTAIKERAMISSDDLYVDFLAIKRGNVMTAKNVGFTAWYCTSLPGPTYMLTIPYRANAFMNAWNSEFVHAGYEMQSMGYITNVDGKVRLQIPAVASEIKRLGREEGAEFNAQETIRKAIKTAKENTGSKFPYNQPTFGYVVQWLSELGKDIELEGLLSYADAKLNPTWENGGLYYPRNDTLVDEGWNFTHMDPFSGNTAIGYSRLNVKSGQKLMWERPWTKDDLCSRPWVDGIDLSHNVDCLRGIWDEQKKAVIITLKTWNDEPASIQFTVKNLELGTWAAYEQGRLSAVHELVQGADIHFNATVEPSEEMDIVVVKDEGVLKS